MGWGFGYGHDMSSCVASWLLRVAGCLRWHNPFLGEGLQVDIPELLEFA
jgi:hypothetical protein